MAAEIIIVEDHPLFAAGLREMAEDLIPNCSVLCENSLQSALDALQNNQPRLIISDLNLGDASGFDILDTLRSRSPDSIVVGITGDCELLARQSNPAHSDDADSPTGALNGLLLAKTDSMEQIFQQLFSQLQVVNSDCTVPRKDRGDGTPAHRGPLPQSLTLTRKQRQVLGLISEGLSNKEIARRMLVSPETVKSHAKSLFKQLGVKNRTQAASRIKRLLGRY